MRVATKRSEVFHKKRSVLVGAMAVALVPLAGCVSPEAIRTSHGIDLPDTYQSTSPVEGQDALVLTDIQSPKKPEKHPASAPGWIADFQSSEVEDLVAEALANNRDLMVAAARVRESRAYLGAQTGALLPTLSADGSVLRTAGKIEKPGGGRDEVQTNLWSAGLDLSWEIDLWGKLYNRRQAAAFDLAGERATYEAAQLSLTGQVIRSWFTLVEADEQLRLAEETQASFERAETLVRRRYEQGLSRALDVRLAASNAASARALTQARRDQAHAASTGLEVLVGRYPAGALSGDGELPLLTPQWTEDMPSALLARRPDLSAAHAAAVAAELRERSALKAMLPSIRLTGSGGYQDSAVKDLENPANIIWSLAGGVIQPLFQGGALKAEADAARARGDMATARYAQTLLVAFQEVEMALHSEETLALREEASREAAEQARAAEETASDLYARGLSSIFELLEAQRRSLNAQSSYLEVRRLHLVNRVSLYLALGGEVPVASPVQAAQALSTPPSSEHVHVR